VLAVDEVVGRHDRPGVGLGDGDLEPGQVELAQGALVDDRVEPHPVVLLVVRREVLEARPDSLRLDAARQGRGAPAREQGVLREVLEVPAARRVALDVQSGPQEHADLLGTALAPEGPADLEEEVGSQVEPRADAVGKHVAGTESPRPTWSADPACLRNPCGLSVSITEGRP
jgi:hypothetical protein